MTKAVAELSEQTEKADRLENELASVYNNKTAEMVCVTVPGCFLSGSSSALSQNPSAVVRHCGNRQRLV